MVATDWLQQASISASSPTATPCTADIRLDRANHLAQKINALINQTRSACLSRLSNATTKELHGL